MMYPIKKNNQYGFIDSTGNIIVQPEFNFASHFSENVCLVGNKIDEFHFNINNQDYFHNEFSYIDINGNLLFPFIKYYFGREFSEGLAFVYHEKERKWGVINKNAQLEIPFILENCDYSKFSEGISKVKGNNKWGYINKKGELIIPYQFDEAGHFQNGYALVKESNKNFFINHNGEKLKTIKCNILSGFTNGLAKVSIQKKVGFVNTVGELAFDSFFDDSYGDFSENICGVTLNKKGAFIDKYGNRISDFIFDDYRAFNNGTAPVKIKKKWTLIDESAKIQFEPTFDYIHDFGKFAYNIYNKGVELTLAMQKNELVYINKIGAIIHKYETFNKGIEEGEILKLLISNAERKEVWDKVKWSYDGISITKNGAIRPFYFILKWFNNKNLLTDEGVECLNDKNNLEIGLYRFMFKDTAAIFLDYFYSYWYEKQSIANYQIDPNLKFVESEELDRIWKIYEKNKK
jgi:hypothetical protein